MGPEDNFELRQPRFTPAVDAKELLASRTDGPEEGLELAEPNELQRRKMVDYLVVGNPFVLNDATFQTSDETFASRKEAVARMAPSPEIMSSMLMKLKPPVEDEDDRAIPEKLFGQVQPNPQQLSILARHSGRHLAQRSEVTAEDLGRLLEELPEPIAFERWVAPFLEVIAGANQDKPLKLDQYRRSVLAFQRTVYGKRQQYWEQFQGMYANNMVGDHRWRAKWRPGPDADATGPQADAA